MEVEFDDRYSAQLTEAIKNISAMVNIGAGCNEVATAAAQCTSALLPGACVVFVELLQDCDAARILAKVNAPHVAIGDEIPAPIDSVLRRAGSEPFRVHHEPYNDENILFPSTSGFAGDLDEIISYKAAPRTGDRSIVFAIVASPDMAGRANGVLMTLSELLTALCAGREVSATRNNNLLEIERAKREWERTVDALPEVVCLVDREGRIVRANRTLERWNLGDVTRVRGISVHTLFHPGCDSDSCSLRDALSLSLAAQSSNGFLESAIKDRVLGRTLIVHTRLMNGDLNPAGEDAGPSAVIVTSDITLLDMAQQELALLNRGLEQRVEARTTELSNSVRDLAEEVDRRRFAEVALEASRDELAKLSKQLINAQEEERRKLSRELHDSLGQSLGAIKYSLERIVAMQEKSDYEDFSDDIAGVLQSIGLAIKETRSLAVGLRPPILDDIGIASAISWLCQHFAETFTDIEFHVEIDARNDEVPDMLSTPVYRIVQEALNNVVKHAHANTVLISVRIEDRALHIEVLDDGVGFDATANDTGRFEQLGRIGRLGMRERAINSNGILTIESWPGEGTKVKGEWSLADKKTNTESQK